MQESHSASRRSPKKSTILSPISSQEELKDDPFGYRDRRTSILNTTVIDYKSQINNYFQTKLVSEILEHVQPESWNNIPVCIVKATKSFIEMFKIIEQRIDDNQKLFNDKSKRNANMCRRLEKAIHDTKLELKSEIECSQRVSYDKVFKVCNDNQFKIELMEARFEEMREKVQAEREFIDTRLSRIDDSTIIKKWMESKLSNEKYEITGNIDRLEKEIKTSLKRLTEDNLIVPGLIGPNESYQNLRQYIGDSNEILHKHMAKYESRITMNFTKELKNLQSTSIEKLKDLDLRLTNNIQNNIQTLSQNVKSLDQGFNNEIKVMKEYQEKTAILAKELDDILTNEISNQVIDLQEKLTQIQSDSVSQINTIKGEVQEIISENVKEFIEKQDQLSKNIKVQLREMDKRIESDKQELLSKYINKKANPVGEETVSNEGSSHSPQRGRTPILNMITTDFQKEMEKLVELKIAHLGQKILLQYDNQNQQKNQKESQSSLIHHQQQLQNPNVTNQSRKPQSKHQSLMNHAPIHDLNASLGATQGPAASQSPYQTLQQFKPSDKTSVITQRSGTMSIKSGGVHSGYGVPMKHQSLRQPFIKSPQLQQFAQQQREEFQQFIQQERINQQQNQQQQEKIQLQSDNLSHGKKSLNKTQPLINTSSINEQSNTQYYQQQQQIEQIVNRQSTINVQQYQTFQQTTANLNTTNDQTLNNETYINSQHSVNHDTASQSLGRNDTLQELQQQINLTNQIYESKVSTQQSQDQQLMKKKSETSTQYKRHAYFEDHDYSEASRAKLVSQNNTRNSGIGAIKTGSQESRSNLIKINEESHSRYSSMPKRPESKARKEIRSIVENQRKVSQKYDPNAFKIPPLLNNNIHTVQNMNMIETPSRNMAGNTNLSRSVNYTQGEVSTTNQNTRGRVTINNNFLNSTMSIPLEVKFSTLGGGDF